MKYPSTILNLIECFKKLPGIGEKTAERLALSMLDIDDEVINLFSKSLTDVKTKIKRCSVCNNLSEEDKCQICKDNDRNNKLICVVEEPKNVILFEKLNIFDGYYHVLDGLISPIDGINPEDINEAIGAQIGKLNILPKVRWAIYFLFLSSSLPFFFFQSESFFRSYTYLEKTK